MTSIFTEYVHSLGPAGEPAAAARFESLLGTLRGALVHEMKRRSVWGAPPSYLGVYGGNTWSEGDLLEDLVLDCYRYIFLERLAGLRRQARVRVNLDGLIFLNIRHFLHEAQRRHDPLGLRLFEITRAAVESLVADGGLHVLAGDQRLRNDTVLAFASWHDAQEAVGADLEPHVAAWSHELAAEMLTAWGREGVTARLAEKISGLAAAGIEVFLLRDLLDPLKREMRGRWRLFQAVEDDAVVETSEEGREWVKLVRPDRGVEERQSFAKLVACMGERLDKTEERERTRDYLRRLWLYLRQWAAEPGTDPGEADGGERLPSDKMMGELLDIPRARIPRLKASLGRLLENCRGAVGAARGASSGTDAAGLRRATGQASAAAAAAEASLAERAGSTPGPGDILLFPGDVPAEWLIVEVDETGGRFRVVAVDDVPFVGSGDLEVTRSGGERARARCRVDAWLPAAKCVPEVTSGEVSPEDLERVRRRREDIARGELVASSEAREIDGDFEYRDWIVQLEAAASELGDLSVREDNGAEIVAFEPRRPRPAVVPWRALAAVFATAAVGLGLWNAALRQSVARWSEPVLVGGSATQTIRFDPERQLQVRAEQAGRHVVFRLPLTRYVAYDAFRLRVAEAANNEDLWTSEWISGESELLLVLPREKLRAERYVLRLEGRQADGKEVEIDETEVDVERID